MDRLLREFRIGEGGLLRRVEVAAHLTSLRSQILALIATTWVPVVTLGLIRQWRTGLPEPILLHPAMYVRLLIAAPTLLFIDHVFPRVCTGVLDQLISQRFVPDGQLPRFERLMQRATRLANSVVPELVLAVVCIGLGVGAVLHLTPRFGTPAQAQATPAQVWYWLTDWPLFQFLLWRSLWRWGVWARLLAGLSRIDLELIPGHPDRRGGIRFLRLPSLGYCVILLFVSSSVLSAEWHDRFELGETLASVAPMLTVLGVAGALVAFGPLLLFSPMLQRAQTSGRTEYDRIANEACRDLLRRWRAGHGPPDARGVSAINAVADLVVTYSQAVYHYELFLFDRYDLIFSLVATLLPVVPVMIVNLPKSVWQELFGLVLP